MFPSCILSFANQTTLDRLSKLLRGGSISKEDVNTLATLSEVKDVAKAHISGMKTINQQIIDRDRDGVLFAANSQYLSTKAKDINHITSPQLSNMLEQPYEDMDDVIQTTNDLVRVLEKMDSIEGGEDFFVDFTNQELMNMKEMGKNSGMSGHLKQPRRRLQQVNEETVCTNECSVSNTTCNCNKLYECAQSISTYDLAVSLTKGYIHTNPSNMSKFGTFTVKETDIDLFNASGGIYERYDNIHSVLSSSTNVEKCQDIIENFVSACPTSDKSCSAANTQTYEMTTDEVCAAVNTGIKLNFKEILLTLDPDRKLLLLSCIQITASSHCF